LPISSQNDTIYENCLEIVKSILNNDGEYDKLLESEESLKDISSSLKIKRAALEKRIRQTKPKNYWLLNFKDNEFNISLRLGIANVYTKDTLTDILGIEAVETDYQLFIDDNLVCIFRKMTNGKYKTDWYNQENRLWSDSAGLPHTFVISNGEKIELPDFIQTIPNLEEPSLWTRFSDNDWRLIKGNSTSIKEAAVLFPDQWKCNLPTSEISLYNRSLSWMTFEGEIEIYFEDEKLNFLSDVNSFDWVIQSKKPTWMLKSTLPVVQGIPNILVFDDDGYDIKRNKFKVFIKKHSSKDDWRDISLLKFISTGCFDLKIEKDNLIAHDIFFNIGNLQARYLKQSIHYAEIEFKNLDYFKCNLNESSIVKIEEDNFCYKLTVNTELSQIPTMIRGSLGFLGKKKLFFELVSPFQGMAITDKDGKIINEEQSLSLANLYGMRILSTPNNDTILKIKNSLKSDVKIIKEIKESTQPVITFKDEIIRLFYLADALDYRNTVSIELSEGRYKKTFEISGFSHTLDVSQQMDHKISLFQSEDNLDLFAVPINCLVDEIEPIPLVRNEFLYEIPKTEITNQFIIISSKKDGEQVMPRFVNTDEFLISKDKDDRIVFYHNELSNCNFGDSIWKQVLVYFNICVQYNLPFSTFDQLRAISRSSAVASRAFFFIGINQLDSIEYIQKSIPEMEKDLGFCFHWVSKVDWTKSLDICTNYYGNNYKENIRILCADYMDEIGLFNLCLHIFGYPITEVFNTSNTSIRELRRQLSIQVQNELPYNSPFIRQSYNIQIEEHKQVRLLLQAPIAVAESINGTQKEYSIWGGDERREVIRRNIQYSQYLKPDFYNKTILHVLTRN
jgi:hypothetical protein